MKQVYLLTGCILLLFAGAMVSVGRGNAVNGKTVNGHGSFLNNKCNGKYQVNDNWYEFKAPKISQPSAITVFIATLDDALEHMIKTGRSLISQRSAVPSTQLLAAGPPPYAPPKPTDVFDWGYKSGR
jgi:hypothetical protein